MTISARTTTQQSANDPAPRRSRIRSAAVISSPACNASSARLRRNHHAEQEPACHHEEAGRGNQPSLAEEPSLGGEGDADGGHNQRGVAVRAGDGIQRLGHLARSRCSRTGERAAGEGGRSDEENGRTNVGDQQKQVQRATSAAGALPPGTDRGEAVMVLLGPLLMAALMQPDLLSAPIADRLVDRLFLAALLLASPAVAEG